MARDTTARVGVPPGAALLLLLLATCAVYAPVLGHDFVQWDDPYYVTENPHVRAGLSASGIVWALTSTELANWHPLTWMSHMLDVSLFGLAPWGHHLTSLLLHLANTALLFAALRRLTGAPWRSLATAALFALHPLHVESVAWVSERKDVLSTAFYFAALWAYAASVQRPAPGRDLGVALLMACGLMAKPMLVSLPCLLLILDAWPLRRLREASRRAFAPRVVEKLPLFVLALAAALTAWLAQRAYGAVTDSPLATRLANVVLGYAGYLEKAVWPASLCAFYPYRAHVSAVDVGVAGAGLVAITVLVARAARSRPYLAAGWAWYLVTLAPVVGVVRIGQQAMADRYTYVPLVGVFIMAVWGGAELAASVRAPAVQRTVTRLAVVLLVAALALGARRQLGTWRDGITLWEHALAVGGNSTVAQNNLGVALEHAGRLDEAAAHYIEAIGLEPRNARAHGNLGNVRFAQGRMPEAIAAYERSLVLQPAQPAFRRNLARARYNLANADWREGDLAAAVAGYREAIRDEPGDAGFQRALGLALLQRGSAADAEFVLRRALELDTANAASHDALALALVERGDVAGAWREVRACRAHGGTPTPALLERLSRASTSPK